MEPTSYDYDALISEAGDLTPKYYAFKEIISKYMSVPDIPIPNPVPLKKSYGVVDMKYVSSAFVANGTLLSFSGKSLYPKTFEQIGQENGFMLYETTIGKKKKKEYSNWTSLCKVDVVYKFPHRAIVH